MKLIKILSDRVQIRTDQSEFGDIRINDLISISDGYAELVTTVTSVTDNDVEAGIDGDEFILGGTSIRVIECSIIGSIQDGKFQKSIERYPVTSSTAKEITPEDFSRMLQDPAEGFCIGKYAGYGCEAWVDGNKFFQRHACIVGNTGSGKSETVAKILEESSGLPGTNIVVFDIHGEYRELSYVRNIPIGRDYPFPIWMFGFSDMVANILKVREESSSVVMSALRKCYYRICPNGRENRPACFDFEEMLRQLKALNEEEVLTGEIYKTGDKAGTAKTVKGDFNGKLTGIIHTMEDRQNDRRYEFLFETESQEYLLKVVNDILGNDKPVKNIDLSDVPHDVAIPLIGVITRLIYEIQKTYSFQELAPVTIICDEAHVYIPNDFQLSASERRMVAVFEEIAKEGRKFGTTLIVASQRPSELNKTIMAQCANFIVAKLNNENDKSMIKGMLPDGNESVIDATTTFSPGEVLMIGDAVQIPLKIKVDRAGQRPQSRTISFWDEWTDGKAMDLETGIHTYMKY